MSQLKIFFKVNMNQQPKPKPFRSEKYKAFIRERGCLVCGRSAVAHHEPVLGRGIATKGNDTECVPLCVECHSQRHSEGVKTFWGKRDIDPRLWIIRLLTEYLQGKEKP
jgi:hypothetical protein